MSAQKPQGHERVYCVSCTVSDCAAEVCTEHETCWQKHVDRDDPEDRHKHQIVDPFPSMFVDVVTHSEISKERLKRLHEEDESARWFSVKLGEEEPELWQYDRFIRLCDPQRTGSRDIQNHFPSFVSFIGDTSAGKSTIVRAMLLLGMLKHPQCECCFATDAITTKSNLVNCSRHIGSSMPVTRSGNIEDKRDSTTFGVHLYLDDASTAEKLPSPKLDSPLPIPIGPATEYYPLLFVDCEGFNADDATTNAQKMVQPKDHIGVKKDPITAQCYSNKRKSGIDLFYARVLYAISDVIVYVTTHDQTFRPDLIRVLEWASAAVKKSYNQPSRKTLIIVRNKEDSEVPYTNAMLEKTYLHSLDGKLWDGPRASPVLKAFVKDHNRTVQQRHHIESNRDLYDALFQDIRCCSIPHKDVVIKTGQLSERLPRPVEVYNSLKELRNVLELAADKGRRERSGTFAHYNVAMFNHILIRTFDHFRSSEDPLDFYRAARRDNPTPHNIPDHVANFLRIALESRTTAPPGVEDMIISAIASMCFVYAQRCQQMFPDSAVDTVELFEHDLQKSWTQGLLKYLAEYETCSQTFPGSNGTLMHCTVKGRHNHTLHVYSPEPGIPGSKKARQEWGEFSPRRSWTLDDQKAWYTRIKRCIFDLYHRAFVSLSSPGVRQAIRLRRDAYRTQNGNYYGLWKILQSNKTCLACLQSVPDHVLSCGHSYCPRCVQELANESQSFESAFDMKGCILCGTHGQAHLHHQIRLKPRCAGVRILTMDGGGIRGIVELALLRALGTEIGLSIDIGDMFDLVVGTSTGGIVALALVMAKAEDRSYEAMINFFQKAATQTFRHSRAGFDVGTKFLMLLGKYGSKYSSEPLKHALSHFFGEETILFAPATSRGAQSTTRVAVTTAKDEGGSEYLIANYNRPKGNWERFEREDQAADDMRIWEAGLATSAAPFFLPPFFKSAAKADYVDGAVYANCPAKVAMEEKENLWPDGGTSLDILLSLGTGRQVKTKPKILTALRYGAFTPLLKMFDRQMNTESNWDDLVRTSPTNIQARLYRLNPAVKGRAGGYVDIDDEDEVDHLLELVKWWTTKEGLLRIQHISHTLVANLFYFEPDPRAIPEEGAMALSGSIRSRLQHKSESLDFLLTNKVSAFWHTTVHRTEVPHISNLAASRWRLVKNRYGVTTEPARMIVEEDGIEKFRLNFEVLCSQSGAAYHVLAVQLAGVPMKIAISGFPATLEELGERSRGQWLQ
ncbi:hypothetical protein DL98DRAFT_632761 [Cadophora sp. DSE1049]|nr:hypothetical protein DL98DRAFT_632761 [Cadophora sp. DSE1049]